MYDEKRQKRSKGDEPRSGLMTVVQPMDTFFPKGDVTTWYKQIVRMNILLQFPLSAMPFLVGHEVNSITAPAKACGRIQQGL